MHGERSLVGPERRRRRGAQNADRRAQQFAHERLVLVLHEELPPLIVTDQAGLVTVVDLAVVDAQHHRQHLLGEQVSGQVNGLLRTSADTFQQNRADDDDLEPSGADPLLRSRGYRLLDRHVTHSGDENDTDQGCNASDESRRLTCTVVALAAD